MQFDLTPFFQASLAVQVHTLTALVALGLGLWLFVRRKGGRLHRRLGLIWMGLMIGTALVSFAIRQVNDGAFSPIHLLSVLTLGSVVYAYGAVRRGNLMGHRMAIIGLYWGGLVIAGALALSRDLLLHRIFFGAGNPGLLPSPDRWWGGPVLRVVIAGCVFLVLLAYGAFAGPKSRSS